VFMESNGDVLAGWLEGRPLAGALAGEEALRDVLGLVTDDMREMGSYSRRSGSRRAP